MVYIQHTLEERGYVYDIPTRGVVSVSYNDILNDTKRLVSFLTSLNLPFDAPGLLEMFEFLHERPYVLHQYPTLRDAVNDISRVLRSILNDQDNEDGLVQQSVVVVTDDYINQCRRIETLIDAVERL